MAGNADGNAAGPTSSLPFPPAHPFTPRSFTPGVGPRAAHRPPEARLTGHQHTFTPVHAPPPIRTRLFTPAYSYLPFILFQASERARRIGHKNLCTPSSSFIPAHSHHPFGISPSPRYLLISGVRARAAHWPHESRAEDPAPPQDQGREQPNEGGGARVPRSAARPATAQLCRPATAHRCSHDHLTFSTHRPTPTTYSLSGARAARAALPALVQGRGHRPPPLTHPLTSTPPTNRPTPTATHHPPPLLSNLFAPTRFASCARSSLASRPRARLRCASPLSAKRTHPARRTTRWVGCGTWLAKPHYCTPPYECSSVVVVLRGKEKPSGKDNTAAPPPGSKRRQTTLAKPQCTVVCEQGCGHRAWQRGQESPLQNIPLNPDPACPNPVQCVHPPGARRKAARRQGLRRSRGRGAARGARSADGRAGGAAAGL